MNTLFKNWSPFAASKIDGAKIVLTGASVYVSNIYITYKFPPLNFSKIEKLYWQNDIDGVNNLINAYMNATDCKKSCIHFAKNSVFLRYNLGVNIPNNTMEIIDVCNINHYDVFFGIDDEGDLVRAEVA